jgi:hypothetical protein
VPERGAQQRHPGVGIDFRKPQDAGPIHPKVQIQEKMAVRHPDGLAVRVEGHQVHHVSRISVSQA